jgi:hypothetical protein
MKKNYLLIALVLFAFSTKAQYFQHLYGTSSDDSLVSGINTTVQGTGYFMAGENSISCIVPGLNGIPASFTDVNGNVSGTPYFNREYLLTNASGNYIEAHDPQVFEADDSSGFGIVGRYNDPSSSETGVFYLLLDPTGNPTATYRYPATAIGGTSYDIVEVAAVRENIAKDSIYVTGTAESSLGQFRHFILKVDISSGALGWGWVYSILPTTSALSNQHWGKDIIENPWIPMPTPSSNYSVMMVGWIQDSIHSPNYTYDGLITHVDGETGLFPVHPAFIYGIPDSNEWFNCITLATDSIYHPPGFVIGGGAQTNGNIDFYCPRVDPIGHPLWISNFDYSWSPGSYNECFDIIERIDSSGKFTYFAAGYTENGYFGGRDAQVVKMDSMGMPIAGGEFTFGGTGNDYGKALDIYNNNGALPPDGLSTFGTWNSGSGIGGQDLYLVRSYYNGESGCNDTTRDPIWNHGEPGHPPIHPDTLTHFTKGDLGEMYILTTDINLCFSSTIPGGSNAFVAPNEEGEEQGGMGTVNRNHVLLVPNPSNTGNTKVELNVDSDIIGDADVIIYDMNGKEFYKGTFNLHEGMNKLPLDVTNAHLSAGMYQIIITNGVSKLNTMMMVR